MIDYMAVVDDLTRKRSAIERVLEGFQLLLGAPDGSGHGAGLAAPRQLGAPRSNHGGGARVSPRRRAARAATASSAPAAVVPAAPSPRRRRRTTQLAPEVLARVRKRWEAGEDRHAIAKGAGIGYSTLYVLARREHWPAAQAKASPARPKRGRVWDPGYQPSAAE